MQLRDLTVVRFTDSPVTSVFLDLRLQRTRRPGLVFLKKELSRLEKSLTPRSKDAEWGREDIRIIGEAVAEAERKGANHMAVFTSAKEGFLEKFFWTLAPEADLRIPNSFMRGARPHLYPLALLADRLEHFLLLVADLRRGELFKVEAGRITERWESRASAHSETRREKGGAYDRRTGNIHTTFTKRVEGHLKTHEEKFFKKLAEQTASWAKSDGIRTVILGADLVAGPPVRDKIRRQNGRLEVVLAPIDAKLSSAKKLALGIRAFRQQEQEISIRRVEELYSPGRKQAYFGAVEILNVLRESKRAGVLILDEAFHQETPLCGRCSTVTTHLGACPGCSGPVENASLENELVCLAAASGAEIEFVKDSVALAQKGGVGLLL